jgi:predicted component of type VI protein secretion system
MRAVEHLRHFADDSRSRRIRELRKLFEMLAQLMSRARGLDRRADQNGALRGRVKIDRVS